MELVIYTTRWTDERASGGIRKLSHPWINIPDASEDMPRQGTKPRTSHPRHRASCPGILSGSNPASNGVLQDARDHGLWRTDGITPKQGIRAYEAWRLGSSATDVREKETFQTLIMQLHTRRLVGVSDRNVPPSD